MRTSEGEAAAPPRHPPHGGWASVPARCGERGGVPGGVPRLAMLHRASTAAAAQLAQVRVRVRVRRLGLGLGLRFRFRV